MRAITAFCRCISTTRRMRSVQRLRVSENSIVPIPAPANRPNMGSRSLASPVGMTMSNIILFAIGVNIPNRASTRAVASRSARLVIDIDLKANFSRSPWLRVLCGSGLQKVMACRLSELAIALRFTGLVSPSLSVKV